MMGESWEFEPTGASDPGLTHMVCTTTETTSGNPSFSMESNLPYYTTDNVLENMYYAMAATERTAFSLSMLNLNQVCLDATLLQFMPPPQKGNDWSCYDLDL